MDEPLPRQTYKTDDDARIEQEMAEHFARRAGMQQMRIGLDQRDRQKPRVDRILHDDRYVRGFFECKSSSTKWGNGEGFITGTRKLKNLRDLYGLVRVPVVMLVRFGCKTIAYFNVKKRPHRIVRNWGRFDRGDPGDIEHGELYLWDDLTKIWTERDGLLSRE
jgi:hypothetical protein